MDATLPAPDIGARVAPIRIGRQQVWYKRSTAPHRAWRYKALGWFAQQLDIPLARPVPKPGGAAALDIERRRIHELDSAGVNVPRLVAPGKDWHALSDCGQPLRSLLRHARSEDRLELASGAVRALKEVHARGQYLSQAFDRNICVKGKRYAFIDFEDDPGSVFTLAEAQARDLLLLLSSMAAHFEHDPSALRALCSEALDDLPGDQRAPLERTLIGLKWLLARVPGAKRMGEARRLILLSTCVLETAAITSACAS